jgi:hypothetical protein
VTLRLALLTSVFLGALGIASAQTEPDTLANRIAELNGIVTAQSTRIIDAERAALTAPIQDSLTERATLLRRLIALDPARAVGLRLQDAAASQVRTLNLPDVLEEQGAWTGTLDHLVEDDFDNRRSQRHIILHAPAGDLELFLQEKQPLPRGDFVQVQGLRVGDRIAAATLVGVAAPASSANLAETAAMPGAETAALTTLDCNTLGDQKTVVIMVTTPASPAFPSGFDATYFTQKYFGGSSLSLANYSVNLFMQDASQSQTSLSGTVVGPFALGQNFTCDQSSSLLSAAIAAADPTVDFSLYRRIIVVFPISTCSYAGLGTIGCSRRTTSDGSFRSSVSWIPITPSRNSQTLLPAIAHEFGHNLGLGHAHTEDFGNITLGRMGAQGVIDEYGDWDSVMGISLSWNSLPIAGLFPAPQRTMILGWMDLSGYQEVQSSGTFGLVPYENASGLRALRILRDPATSSWLWLEYRQPIGIIDSSLSLLTNFGPSTVFQGALIHYEDPNYENNVTRLLDTTPTGTPNQFLDGSLKPGNTWSDTDSLLNITVTSANASGLNASISYSAACAVLQPSAVQFGTGGGSGAITVIAPANCSWTASSAVSWITLTGATSGLGNGSVPFTVSSNGASQRSGFVTVQRQSIRFMQEGSGLNAISVTPSRGVGLSGQFVFRLKHTSGYQAIQSADLFFENNFLPNRPTCNVYYAGSLTSLWLVNDDSATLSSGLTLSNAGTSIANSQCTLSATGSSIVASGTDLTITLQMSFQPSFFGTHRIGAHLRDASSDSGVLALGMWTVQSGGCSYALDSTAQSFSTAGGTGTVGVTTGSGCSWSALSDSGWLTVTSGGSPTSGSGTAGYSVAANSSSSSRTGHLTIGDQTFTVQQNGCSYAFGAASQDFSAAGGSGSMSVLTTAGCAWSVSGGAPWVTLTGATSGTGNGSVPFTVTANATAARTTTFSINGATFTINQASGVVLLTTLGSFAQIASEGTWKTTLNVLNLGIAQGQAQMDFTADSGSSLTLPFTFPQGGTGVTTSSLLSSLNVGAQRISESTGPDSALIGWGKLSGSAGITGFGIFSNPTLGWEAVVPLETRNSSKYILAFDNTGSLATGVALANLSNGAVNITVIIRDFQGNVIRSTTVPLGPLAHTSFMLNSAYNSTTNQRGTVEFQTPSGARISVLGLRSNGPSLTTLPVLADVGTSGGSFAHILYNGGFTNSFTLVNTSASAANVTLNFFAEDGTPLAVPLQLPQSGQSLTISSLAQTIPANGSVLIQTVGQAASNVVAGSATLVTSSQVSGFGIFNWIQFGQEASVPMEDRTPSSFVLAFDNTGGLTTGLALAETAGQAASIPITIRDDAGNQTLSTTLNLPANGHTSFMLPNQYAVTVGARGTIEFTTPSGGRISALGLRATPAGNLTTIPVMAK